MVFNPSAVGVGIGVTQPVTADLARQDANDRPRQRPATMSVIEGNPTAELAPTSLAFSSTYGKANPPVQTITLTNIGTGRLLFTATSPEAYLMVTPRQGRAPNRVQVTALIAGLAVGVHTAFVTIAVPGATVPSISVPVVVTITS